MKSTIAGMLAMALAAAPIESSFGIGVDLGLSASAEVGISAETRALIQGFPAEVREQLIKALKEAQPIVDKSVLSYLDKVDEILSRQLLNVQCTTVGTAIQVGEEVLAPIRGPAQPVNGIERLWAKHATAFEPDTPLTGESSILAGYADLLHEIHKTHCNVQGVREAAALVLLIRLKAARRHNLWLSLQDECSELASCLPVMEAKMQAAVAAADPRDVAVSEVDELRASLKAPEPHRWYQWSFKHAPYEEQLFVLVGMIESVERARAERVAAAAKERDELLLAIESFERANGIYRRAISPRWRDREETKKAGDNAREQLARLPEFRARALAVKAADGDFAAEADALEQRLARLDTLFADTAKRADDAHRKALLDMPLPDIPGLRHRF
jgi:hypothetical protein